MTIHHRHAFLAVCGIVALSSSPQHAGAQLNECALIDALGLIDAPGSCIAKSLAMQIGPGQGDSNTPGSSAYLITRDPARAIRRGRQLFQRKFSIYEGLGPRVTANSTGDILKTRRLGAGLSDSCAACHGRPRGSAGVGGDVTTFPDSRDAPHLFGLGLIEMLADEMTTDLRAIREQAIREARTGNVAPATNATDAAATRLRLRQTQHADRRAARRGRRRSRARSSARASTSAASPRTPTAASIPRRSKASTRICACGRSCTKGKRRRCASSSSAPFTPRWACRRGTPCSAPRPIPRHRRPPSASPASSTTRSSTISSGRRFAAPPRTSTATVSSARSIRQSSTTSSSIC